MADGGWRNVPCPAIAIHPLRGGERQQPEGLGSLKTPRWTTRVKRKRKERERERESRRMHRAELHTYLLTRRCTLVHPPPPPLLSSPSVRPSFDQFPSIPFPLFSPSFLSSLFRFLPPREGKMKSLAGVIHDAQDASMRPFDSRHSYNSVAPVK